MQQKMENLMVLQQIENDINEVLAARRKLAEEGAALVAELEKIQEVVGRLTSDLDAVEKEKRDLQAMTVESQDKITKSEKRLPEISTTKEYTAVMKEIDSAKKATHEVQEKIKLKDSDIDAVRREKEESENILSDVQGRVDQHNAEISPQIAEYDETLSAKNKSREELLNSLPSALRKRYQKLIEQRAGVAVVEAKDGACLGCNMRLPPQFFNNLQSSDEIQSCPHCNRFLFVKIEKKD